MPMPMLTARDEAKVPSRVVDALVDLKRRLGAHFGDRLRELRLFGSYSRGDFHADSDVDVLVVIDALERRERREVFDLAEEVYFDRLIHLSPLVLSDVELDTLRARELLLAADLDRDGIPL